MRQGESPDVLPPEALERIAEERRNHWVGVGLLLVGAIIALVPLLKTGEIGMVPAFLAGAFLLTAGVLIDPDRFAPLASKGIDKLPGK